MSQGFPRKSVIAVFGLIFVCFAQMRLYAEAPKASTRTQAKPAVRVLDQKRIHYIYSEGDFESVVASIDSFTVANADFSQSDSIFIAKHLAVIYSANPATRENGKHYMFRLLSLMPSAKIVDMFVSDEIDHIFEKVREEYVVRLKLQGIDAPNAIETNRYAANKMIVNSSTDPSQENPHLKEKVKGGGHLFGWVAGGVTLVAVAGTAYYFLQPKKTTDEVYDLPE